MKLFQKSVKSALLTGLSLSLLACGSNDEVPASAIVAVTPTPTPIKTPQENIQILFAEDIAEDIRQSEPNDINLPLGLQATLDVGYIGAFRVEADGESTSDYAVGALGFNPDNNSLFMAGHTQHSAIAEFEIPTQLSFEPVAANILEAAVLQKYVKILNKKEIGNTTNKINGILYHEQNLLVSSEIWYDGEARNRDNLQVFSNAQDIRSSGYKGMLQIEGAAKAAGYMFKVPNELTKKLGADYITGWASNYAIRSRYSQGPSLYGFSPEEAIDAVPSVTRTIDTKTLMVFPFGEGKELNDRYEDSSTYLSPLWGELAKAKYGFIIPSTTYFLAVGQHSGLHSGIGYKITQDNGKECGGSCAYESSDIYNYYWIFDINDMLNADEPWEVSPISYGKWSHPYDRSGSRGILGGTFDEQSNTLYLSLEKAGQVGTYDRAPLILSYKIKAKS
jgi:hypothetical protein